MAKTFNTKQEAMAYLQTLSIGEIMDIAANLLLENAPTRKITLSQEQFERYFRIAGFTESGGKETRGRKRKEQ